MTFAGCSEIKLLKVWLPGSDKPESPWVCLSHVTIINLKQSSHVHSPDTTYYKHKRGQGDSTPHSTHHSTHHPMTQDADCLTGCPDSEGSVPFGRLRVQDKSTHRASSRAQHSSAWTAREEGASSQRKSEPAEPHQVRSTSCAIT